MQVDLTAAGIALGVAGSLAYAGLRALRQRTFDIGLTILVFLGLFGCPSGLALIRAGIVGDPSALPTNWREHVAVAGIATIGLSVHFLVGSFRSALAHTIKPVLGSASSNIRSDGHAS